MKILYGYRYGILGGVCTQLINRLAVLTGGPRGEVHLMFKEDHGISRTLGGYPHLHFEADPGRVADLAHRHNFDVAVVIDTPEFLHGLSRVDGLPVITEVHSTLEQGLQYLHDRTWSTVGYIVPSAYLKDLLKGRFGIGAAEAVEVCPNCVDPALFPHVNVEPVPPRTTFCWIGKLDSHKNWRGFLDVAGMLSKGLADPEFWMIGGETGQAAEERDMLHEVHRLGLMNRFRWFPRVEYRSMHRVYAAVRQSGGAQVVTSKSESFGMSVLEALFCGCPVVAPATGALPDIAPGKEYLALYEPGDYSAAARLAEDVAKDNTGAGLRRDLKNDRSDLGRQYSCETVVPRYLKCVQRLLDVPTDPAGAESGVDNTTARESELLEAIDRLRPLVPGLTPNMTQPVHVVSQMRKVLELRSYRLARIIAARENGIKGWLRLPFEVFRSVRSTRGSQARDEPRRGDG